MCRAGGIPEPGFGTHYLDNMHGGECKSVCVRVCVCACAHVSRGMCVSGREKEV